MADDIAPAGPFVIDASALLALLYEEPGSNDVEDALADGSISAANLSETISKLIQNGVPGDEAEKLLRSFDLDMIPVDAAIAYEAGRLITFTMEHGLSLGDRLCLATGIVSAKPVLTADRVWAELDREGLDVRLIR